MKAATSLRLLLVPGGLTWLPAAAPRPDRPLADKGRRQQVRKLIQTIKSSH